ncbi:hypothetical protein ACCT25_38000, partial [Rhizobium ruizarguesonis]
DRGEGERKGCNAPERYERQYNEADEGKKQNLSQDPLIDEVGEHVNSFTRVGGDQSHCNRRD